MAQQSTTKNNKPNYLKTIKELQKEVDNLKRQFEALKRAFLSKGV